MLSRHGLLTAFVNVYIWYRVTLCLFLKRVISLASSRLVHVLQSALSFHVRRVPFCIHVSCFLCLLPVSVCLVCSCTVNKVTSRTYIQPQPHF